MSARLNSDGDVLAAYSTDVSGLRLLPESVARPDSAEHVVEIMTEAFATRTPVTPAGGQTSTTGASITDRGILLSTRDLARLIDLDAPSGTVTVQPGVLLADLNTALRDHGYFFAPDPTSLDAVTVGGAIACNASGARSFPTALLGTMSRN
jgi:glycolate oxidase